MEGEIPTIHVKAVVGEDGTVTIHGLPLRQGEEVEVIIVSRKPATQRESQYALRGTPFEYDHPFDGVAEEKP